MTSADVNNWVQEGELCVWRYLVSSKNSYGGLNLLSNAESTNSIIQLLTTLQAVESANRTIKLTKPTSKDVSVTGFDREYEWYTKIKLKFERSYAGITFAIENEFMMLEVGESGSLELISALYKYGRGNSDFSIRCNILGGSKNDFSLWFW